MTLRRRTMIARRLRWNTADVERIEDPSHGLEIRRQHSIGPLVVDFACPARKLAIELDGGRHVIQHAADAARSVAGYGYRVIRCWKHEALENLGGVRHVMLEASGSPPPHPDPLRPGAAERERTRLCDMSTP